MATNRVHDHNGLPALVVFLCGFLPTPPHPAMGLWIAAGVVLGLTVLIFLMSMAVACSGLNWGP